jgi:guanylate kinase
MLILIYGRSGTGKTRLLRHLVDNYNIKEIVSVTTKKKEPSDGNYYYVDPAVFERIPMAERAEIEGSFYGIPLQELKKANDGYAAAVVDWQGIKTLTHYDYNNKYIKISANYSDLIDNYFKRGYSFKEGLDIINSEMQYCGDFINCDLEIKNDMITPIQEYAEEVLNIIGFYKGE